MSILFQEHFNENTNLAQNGWVGKGGTVPSAEVVQDPRNSSNYALTFTEIIMGGDIFSESILSPSDQFLVCGRYLSIEATGADPSNSGGYIGYSCGANPYVSQHLYSDHYWNLGTESLSGASGTLKDNREME